MTGINKISFVFSLFIIAFTLSGCDAAENYLKAERSADMQMQDVRDGLAPRVPDIDDGGADVDTSSIPPLQPYVASASESMKSMPIVSISVNQSVPLRDVLFELAEQANFDLELDPRIRGSIIFTARERPFDQVIDRISEMSGLRYSFKDDVLRVELDMPYNKTYKINYLSYIRTNTGSVRNDIAVVSGEGADTGSAFSAESSSEADFWGELESNLVQLLGGGSTGALKTSRDPRITATDQNPEVQAVVAGTGADGEAPIQVQAPQATLTVNSLPIDDEDGNSGNGSRNDGDLPEATFSINKQAGLINVFGSERQHKEIREYLKVVERSSTSQVLIEAKILEVTLNDEYSTGIDWRALDLLSGELSVGYLAQGVSSALANAATSSTPSGGVSLGETSNFVLGYAGNDAQAVIEAVSGFGTVRALASPRMTVLNNQSAVLNVATNQVFFEIDIDVTTDDGATQTDIDSDIRNVPEGILVNVQPSINLDEGTVALAVRPTITRITGEVSDPAIQFITAAAGIVGVESNVPELNVQEIDSVIKVRSGQPVIMGGLLQDRSRTNEEGVPILGEVPVFGSLFKKHSDLIQKTELIIFLKATILDQPTDSIHNTDRDIYRKFSTDRRPFKM
mgnify:CR=1 FL=1